MQHSRFPLLSFRSPRFVSATSAFLAVSTAGLALPQRGVAQDDLTRQPSAQGNGAQGDQGNNNGGQPNNGDMNGGDPNSGGNSGNGAGGGNDRNNDPNANNGVYGNGGDSAAGPNGGTSNPSVGVDNAGSTGAVGTRSGRTSRPQPRVAPPNPLVLTVPTRGNGPAVNTGTTARPAPFIPLRQPGNFTLQTDPYRARLGPFNQPLQLFGYGIFQPARQIIIARRRALLPRPRVVQQFGTGTRGRTSGTQAGAGGTSGSNNNNGSFGNGSFGFDPNNPDANTQDPNGSLNGDTANGTSRNGTGRKPAADANGGNGTIGNNPNDPNYDPNAVDAAGAVIGGGQGYNGQNGGQNGSSQDYNGQNGSSQGYNGGYNNGYNNQNGGQNLDNGQSYNNNLPYNGGDSGQPYADDGTSQNGQMRRRPGTTNGYLNGNYNAYPNGTYPNGTYPNGSFPGDTAAPGSDIQFPGDDALIQNGAGNGTNALGGQFADPISALYAPVFTSPPAGYQFQPGDVLTIGYSALTLPRREFSATVDGQGGVSVEGVGRVSVVYKTEAQAEAALRARLSRLYRDVDVSINLRQLRTIQVTVSGNSFAPGTYPVPASTTAFSLLLATGGPTANGSLRDIRVLRNGRRVSTLDFYPLIAGGTANPSAKGGDIALRSGDIIFIPSPVSRVTVRGEVRTPAVYELTPADTLLDALNYGGGIKPSGVDQNVHIDTVNNGTGRVIVDVNLRNTAQAARTPVFDGDTVDVSSVRAILTNRVTIAGAVDQPADYALTPGMRVADLVARARGVLINTYLGRAELTHLNADLTTSVQPINLDAALANDSAQNVPLRRFDTLQVFSLQDAAYQGRRTAEVRGDVQQPGLYTQSDNMRVSDLLLQAHGPLPDAYLNRAVLLHQRPDGTYAYEYVSLRGTSAGNPDADPLVLDNDILAVYRIGEAHFTPDHTVKILGDVLEPGLYPRGENMKISDLVKLAGAYKPGGGTVVMVSHARQSNTALPSSVAPPVVVAFNGAGVLGASGDTALQDGDVVTVQGNGTIKDHPPIVTVTGAVAHPGPFPIDSKTRLSDAIAKAGGLLPEAFPQGAEFTRLSGTLVTTGQMTLAQTISRSSDLLNVGEYQREKAKAVLTLIEAAGSAASGTSSSSIIPIPGAGGGGSAANPNVGGLVDTLRSINPVSPGRLLTQSQLQPDGSVAIRLVNALKRPGGSEDFLLKDGDTIVVPETPTTVQVVGAVFAGKGVVFKPGQSVDYYINFAGGFTQDAAKDRIEVIHAGGGLIPASAAGAIQPGDLILVPTKVLAEKITRSGNAFTNFLQGLVGSAVVLRLLTR